MSIIKQEGNWKKKTIWSTTVRYSREQKGIGNKILTKLAGNFENIFKVLSNVMWNFVFTVKVSDGKWARDKASKVSNSHVPKGYRYIYFLCISTCR